MIARVKLFFEESKQEFKRISWPSWRETRKMTLIVVIFSIGVAVFLGVWDFVFTFLLEQFFIG